MLHIRECNNWSITINQGETLEFIWNNVTHSSGEVNYRANVLMI